MFSPFSTGSWRRDPGIEEKDFAEKKQRWKGVG